jgi:hypothetical protein
MKVKFLLALVAFPAFALMLRYGIYTMHDFHVFRQFEFDKCIQSLSFPCRWAPDAGMGYGEPLFNFYSQFPYWIGEVFHLSGLSIINSVKLLFIGSIVASGMSMYWLSRKHWGYLGGVVSAVLYMYAPYRAIDVWVRGALNESLAFVLFPIILGFIDRYVDEPKTTTLLSLSIALALLITTHNLSFVMFIPFAALWLVWRVVQKKKFSSLFPLAGAGILAMLLSAYYLLPVLAEGHLVTVGQTTQGYYDYRAHFATLHQLFIDRSWKFGASLWGPVDDMSFSLGQIHWVILGIAGVIGLWKKNWKILGLTILAILAIWLTHNKSMIIWQTIPGMPYIQFPWRFLSVAAFFTALVGGSLLAYFPKKILASAIVITTILVNFTFFRPDIWRAIGDDQQFSGGLWDEQRSSALQDFWPKSAPQMPVSFAMGHNNEFSVVSVGEWSSVPIVYFPGWKAHANDRLIEISPRGDLGLISFRLPPGEYNVRLEFTNTPSRTVGNIISIVTLLAVFTVWINKKQLFS